MKPLNAAPVRPRLGWRIEDLSAAEAVIDVFDVIGDPYEGVAAQDFVQDLRAIKVANVRLNIDSPGGVVDDALTMYAALREHPANVTAYIYAAASAATVVAMGANKVVIFKNSQMTIHDAHLPPFAAFMMSLDAASLREVATQLDEESQNLASIYSDKAGGTVDEWRGRMKSGNGNRGTTYRGQAAVDVGLADELATTPARNTQPLRAVAHAEPEPNPLEGISIPPLAEHAGYQKPVPDLTGLFTKHPLKVGGK